MLQILGICKAKTQFLMEQRLSGAWHKRQVQGSNSVLRGWSDLRVVLNKLRSYRQMDWGLETFQTT